VGREIEVSSPITLLRLPPLKLLVDVPAPTVRVEETSTIDVG
jgi:hypothetical protein